MACPTNLCRACGYNPAWLERYSRLPRRVCFGLPAVSSTKSRVVVAPANGMFSLMALCALAAGFTPIGGPVYLAISAVLNAGFRLGAWRIWRRDEVQAEADGYGVEKKVFRFSLYYLFLHFGAFLLEAVLHSYGLGGW